MNVILSVMLAASLALSVPALAQDKPLPSDMQSFVQRVKADKRLLVATAMRLTDAEAKRFWPLYEAYQKDLDTLTKRLVGIVTAYADAYKKGVVSNETARKLIEDSLAVEEAEIRLKRTYLPKLEKALPAAKVARYMQIENKVRAGVRYELAEAIPLVE